MPEAKPYHECPECGSAAVIPRDTSVGRPKHRCTRCGHEARSFACRAFDPNAYDNRPRDGGRVLPILRGQD